MAEEAKAAVATEEDLMGGSHELMPADFKFVRHKLEGPVAHITLNRPEHNLLNERMLLELARGIEVLHENNSIKLIKIDSALPKVFSGGIEVGEYTAQRVFQMLDAFHRVFVAMVDVGKPVMVVVAGPALGGGSELAAFGDIVIATPQAKFAQPEIRLGIFPPLASTIFPYIVGPKLALELVLTGAAISAERAKELGLVNRLVPEAELEKTVNEFTATITEKSGAVLSMAKRAILGGIGLPLKDGLKNSMNIFLNELYKLEDAQEGIRALAEHRKPEWKNR
jgi:cyclohexa-1,5-dienecarbonyl-CoA hydratase